MSGIVTTMLVRREPGASVPDEKEMEYGAFWRGPIHGVSDARL
jgi:hypothetical protein